jgi:hypothetical protein
MAGEQLHLQIKRHWKRLKLCQNSNLHLHLMTLYRPCDLHPQTRTVFSSHLGTRSVSFPHTHIHPSLSFSPLRSPILCGCLFRPSSKAYSFAPLCVLYVQTVRYYDTAANEQKAKFDHRAAVLSTSFSDDTHAFSGGLEASLRE